MKIGNITLDNNVFLAPMAGITDIVFRIICKEFNCGLVYSEMVSSKGFHYNSENTKKLLEIDKRERPVAIQLFGSDPKILASMAKALDNTEEITLFDINMGCPAPKITKNGDGSALLLNPELIGNIVYEVSNATKKPVTIKIRKGFNNQNINALEVAKIAEKNGAKAITIHGRTREQFYDGIADWDIIKKVKENINIPVIGNGDINSPQKAKEIFEYTNCDAIMIGRATQGNPFIFREVNHYLKTGKILPKATFEEKIATAIKHMEMLVEYKGEFTGVREMRKHLGWYTKGIPHGAEIRVAINKTEDLSKMKDLLMQLLEYSYC